MKSFTPPCTFSIIKLNCTMKKVTIEKSIETLKYSYCRFLNGSDSDFNNIVNENSLSEKSKETLLRCLTELQRHSIGMDREIDYGTLAWLLEMKYEDMPKHAFLADYFKNPRIDKEKEMVIFEL